MLPRRLGTERVREGKPLSRIRPTEGRTMKTRVTMLVLTALIVLVSGCQKKVIRFITNLLDLNCPTALSS